LIDAYANDSQYTPITALSDRKYYWRARAYDAAGNVSAWSAVWIVYINAIPTPTPTLLSPGNLALLSDTTPTFVWEAALDVNRYRLQVDNDLDFSSLKINITQAGVSYTPLTGIGNNEFYWKVQARGLDGLWGPWSAVWMVTVDTVAPAPPTLLLPANTTTEGTSTPFFDWDDPLEAESYLIQMDRRSDFTGASKVEGTPIDSHFTPGAALADGKWYWRVRSFDAASNKSPWSSVWIVYVDFFTTPVPGLIAPADTLTTNDKTPTFQWQAVPDVNKYHLQVDDDPLFGSPRIDVKRDNTQYTPTTIMLGEKTWYWHVRARGTDGVWSVWSAPWSFTVDTTALAAPTLGTPPHQATVSASAPTLTWDAIPGAAAYRIQIDTKRDFSSRHLIDMTVSGTSYTPVSLADGNWFWRVRAIDPVGNQSKWSDRRRITVDTTP
jgi:hypothetical protein